MQNVVQVTSIFIRSTVPLQAYNKEAYILCEFKKSNINRKYVAMKPLFSYI